MPRQPIGNKLRFEVFKRDSFTCQYCGQKAPDIVLEVDHLHPVAEGGTNEILNLVTSCVTCNSGKGARLLSDDAMIRRQLSQLEQLEERRQQLEMLMQWQRGLQNLDDDARDQAIEFWSDLAPGFEFSQEGVRYVADVIKRYGLDEVLVAMRTAATQYLKYDDAGRVTADSWSKAVDFIARIARTNHAQKTDPYARDIAYIVGILKSRFSYYFPDVAGDDIRAAFSWGVSAEQVKHAARRASSWTKFRSLIVDLIADARAEFGEEE